VIFVATFMLALVLRAFGFSSGKSRLLESRNRVLEERECRIIWEIVIVGLWGLVYYGFAILWILDSKHCHCECQ
jgi:hypothetical protein